jgi:hypothetical protein
MTLDDKISQLEDELKHGGTMDALRKVMTAHVVRFLRTGLTPHEKHVDESTADDLADSWDALIKELEELPASEPGESSVAYHSRLLEDGHLDADDPLPDEYVQDLVDECQTLLRQIDHREETIDYLVQSTKLGHFRDTQGATNEQR